jgi:serine protease SohB
MEALVTLFYDLGFFAAKTGLILIAVLIAMGFAVFLLSRSRNRPALEIEKLNTRFRDFRQQMQSQIMGRRDFRQLARNERKANRKERDEPNEHRVFVIDFLGDIRALAAENLREEITAILSIAKITDEVVIRLESGGGLVTAYGLAASQLDRIRTRGIKLTICVDKIAASGGYMMACVADHLIAAPFAVIGSIGVIAQVPNLYRLLEKNAIDYREVTAGEYKRTISMFGEITSSGLEKFKSQIEETHGLFKDFIVQHRSRVDITRVATGEHWYGTQAAELNLVDEISTSDDYISAKIESADVYRVRFHGRKRISERLSESLASVFHNLIHRIWNDVDRTRFGV